MNSWVCASTPTVTRTSTRGPDAALAGQRGQPVDLVERVDDDPAHPGVERPGQLGDRLVVAVEADPLRRHPGGQRDGQLAAGADVEVQALLGDDPDHRPAEERLAGVVDVGVRRRPPGSPGSAPAGRPRRGRTPGCRTRAASSRTSRPADGQRAVGAARRRVRGHSCGTSALTSSGVRSQRRRRGRPRSPCSAPASMRSHDRPRTSSPGRRRRAGAGRWRSPSGWRR